MAYDPVVKDIYLTLVNDRGLYDRCLKILLDKARQDEVYGRLRYPIKTACQYVDTSFAALTSNQINQVIEKVRFHLADHLPEEPDLKLDKETLTTEETTMGNTIVNNQPVKEVTYIYGVDIASMKPDQLLSKIQQAKAEIASLNALGVESAYISKQVADIEAAIALMVAKLDEHA